MTRRGIAGAIALLAGGWTAATAQAAPQPGLWIGTKGDVQVSFTVRDEGGALRMTDIVTFCGPVGSESRSGGERQSYRVASDGRVAGFTRRPLRLGTNRARVDWPIYAGGGDLVCPERDFRGVPVVRQDFRPFADGRYEGESDRVYRLRFDVRGGGVLLDGLSGYAGVPDGSSLTGFCGPSGAIGRPARIAPDGSFEVRNDGGDSTLVIRGAIGAGSAGGTYEYSAPTRCTGDDPLSGTMSWAAALTEPAPGAAPTGPGATPPPLPPGPGEAPPAPDPKPQPNNGYGGPPAPSGEAGCLHEVTTGPLAGVAACFRLRGDRWVSSGRVRLNGIDLTPSRPGVRIAIDRRTFAITSTGPVELRLGSLSVARLKLDWRRPDVVLEVKGRSGPKDPGAAFTTAGQGLFGLAVDGSAKLRLEDGRTKLTVTLKIPQDRGPLSRLSGYSGEVTAAADNASGLILDGAKLTFPGMRAGFVEIQSAELAVSQVGETYHFDGGATIFPFRFNRIGIAGELGFGLGDGYFKIAGAVEQLNRALVYGFFLQRLGFEAQINPFGIGGSAAVTFGPQFRLGGDLVSAARLDGSMRYLSGGDADPSALELAGELELAEAKAADGTVTVRGDRSVSAEGTFELTVGGYGIRGAMGGWFDGDRAFNVEGTARISLPGPDEGGDAVFSSRGAGACRRGFGPDVGFGYEWGKGLGGITFAAGRCSLGAWRAQSTSTARAAQAGAHVVRVRRGTRQLAVQLAGAGGPPAVAAIEPGGRRIEIPAGAAEHVDETTLLAADPDTSATYLIVDRPKPGRWRLEPLPGGAPVSAVRTAAPLPRVRVRTRVGGRGATRVLRYRASGLSGRRLQIVDVAGATRKVVVARGGPRGRTRFAPALGAGRHRLVAVVLGPDGVPSGETLTVGRFRAGGGRPAAPRRVRVVRRGTARRVTWRGPKGLRYEVAVRASDGRRLLLVPRGRARSVTVGIVPRGVRVRATVVARDALGRASRPARARG